MQTPPRGGVADGEGLDRTAWSGNPLDTLPRRRPQAPARHPRRPETAQARLEAQSERLTWDAYLRALHLQEDEPGPVTTIIRNATFKVWKRTFLAWAST